MKYIDDFRDPALAKQLKDNIHQLMQSVVVDNSRPLRLMEFCGGHTHTLFRFGIPEMLPDQVEMVHGPGCPVCVLPMGSIDEAIQLANRPDTILTTFGDAVRVPGSQYSLQQAKALGADIRIVYSPMDALKIAVENSEKEVVFFALGFETTMPSTALTLLTAQRKQVKNFSLLCHHITTIPTIESVLSETGHELEGILAPGHVSMVVGVEPFRALARKYRIPIVITGFEPLDMLSSIRRLILLIGDRDSSVVNNYPRVVQEAGNEAGLKAVREVFKFSQQAEWRGLGIIDRSGVTIHQRYQSYDAKVKFELTETNSQGSIPCECGEVLKGRLKPTGCALFGNQCHPEHPMGALMVSSEGACAAYYQYCG